MGISENDMPAFLQTVVDEQSKESEKHVPPSDFREVKNGIRICASDFEIRVTSFPFEATCNGYRIKIETA